MSAVPGTRDPKLCPLVSGRYRCGHERHLQWARCIRLRKGVSRRGVRHRVCFLGGKRGARAVVGPQTGIGAQESFARRCLPHNCGVDGEGAPTQSVFRCSVEGVKNSTGLRCSSRLGYSGVFPAENSEAAVSSLKFIVVSSRNVCSAAPAAPVVVPRAQQQATRRFRPWGRWRSGPASSAWAIVVSEVWYLRSCTMLEVSCGRFLFPWEGECPSRIVSTPTSVLLSNSGLNWWPSSRN